MAVACVAFDFAYDSVGFFAGVSEVHKVPLWSSVFMVERPFFMENLA